MNRWIFLLAFALVFYGNGAAVVETLVNYPSWRLIGENEFTAYHRFIGPWVIGLVVAPVALGTVFTLLLLKFRPDAIPLWAVWVAVLLQAVVWISTATIQVPIQIALSTDGFSAPLLDRLIETNWWLRRVPYAACAVMFLWMAARVMERPMSPPVEPPRHGRG